jgi:membrane protease YdiL (CAAX protease family)
MTEERMMPKPHSLGQSLALHLAPGVLLAVAFLFVAPLVIRAGGSSYLALILCIPLILVPVQTGLLLREKRKSGLQWKSMLLLRDRADVSLFAVLPIAAGLYVLSIAGSLLVAPFRSAILSEAVASLPPWAIVDGLPKNISAGVLILGLLLSGIVAPVVEEIYFRGFLLPRMPISRDWAPVVNAALFSVYHFFSPWNYIAIFLAFLPLAYYVRFKGRLLPVIVTHCLFNSVGIVTALIEIS